MKTKIFCLMILALIFTGCEKHPADTPPDETTPKTKAPESAAPQADTRLKITPKNIDRIVGMQWILKKMTIDGNEYQLEKEVPFIKIDQDGKINGFASVNRFFGGMKIDKNGKITWSPMGSTRMAGPENMMKQESAFLSALPKTTGITSEKIYIYFQSDDGKTEITFYVPVN